MATNEPAHLPGALAIYKDDTYKDLTIYVGPDREVIKAHKAVLCPQSPFFKVTGNVTSGFKESQTNEIAFPEITDIACFAWAIEYLYLGRIESSHHLPVKGWVEILILGDMLLVDYLVEYAFQGLAKAIESLLPNASKAETLAVLEDLSTMYLNLPQSRAGKMKSIVESFFGKQTMGEVKWKDICDRVRVGATGEHPLAISLVADIMEIMSQELAELAESPKGGKVGLNPPSEVSKVGRYILSIVSEAVGGLTRSAWSDASNLPAHICEDAIAELTNLGLVRLFYRKKGDRYFAM